MKSISDTVEGLVSDSSGVGTSQSGFIDAKQIDHAVKHAAHLLPSQGPITAFVHHNTLHALEDLKFGEAVKKGAKLFGCHPYLTEAQYREKLSVGRIRSEDLEAVLFDHLGAHADVLLGVLGTRLTLQKTILEYPLHDGPEVDLRWVIADSNALFTFRADTPESCRKKFISETRQWVMRDFPKDAQQSGQQTDKAQRLSSEIQTAVQQTMTLFPGRIESWSDRTWKAFGLHLQWRICEVGVSFCSGKPVQDWVPYRRVRDLLLQLTGEDSDELVHPLLIQFSAMFLDQGFSHWELPNRDLGFFESFLEMFAQKSFLGDPWRRGLSQHLMRLRGQNVTAMECIQQSLQSFGVSADEVDSFIEQKLLALRGFAGMIWQLEDQGNRVLKPMPKGSLLGFLAVRLLLEQYAVSFLAKRELNYAEKLAGLRSFCLLEIGRTEKPSSFAERNAFRVFEISQILGWSPKLMGRLSQGQWQVLVKEINAFCGVRRRQIYHLAFERKYRGQALDAIALHSKRLNQLRAKSESSVASEKNLKGLAGSKKQDGQSEAVAGKSTSTFQIICCIDDREESFRRYLEEIDPSCETYGAAGFFAVVMYFRGASDAFYSPLCPAVVTPTHYVRETAGTPFQKTATRRSRQRRAIGTVTQKVHVGSRTFAGGWFGTVALGTLATFPLVARVLFPRATAKLRDYFGGFVSPPEVTQVEYERTVDPPSDAEDHLGYSVSEMAGIVQRLLEDISLTKRLSRLVILCGHGSSSLNNPHESAYNCGACAGGRGGPNARVFSRMANDPRVRRELATRGIVIPDDTVFVGGYHNTCDDNVTFYELELLPTTHRKDFQHAWDVIHQARCENALERCRRFNSASLTMTPVEALQHVEARSEDLSQARPEYNHATNALCFVGRRQWSRGLYLDRRSFLQTYDPTKDDEVGTILNRILQAVIPVCAGINLEYYFSCVDHVGYGAGNKLPHNIVSLLGVMDGAASDLRPGLYRQMTEIHEPMRILFVIETKPEIMQRVIDQNPGIALLVKGQWVQLAVFNQEEATVKLYQDGEFLPYELQSDYLDVASSSSDWYRGWRDHLKFASIGKNFADFEKYAGNTRDRRDF